jgi:hypothetical protein
MSITSLESAFKNYLSANDVFTIKLLIDKNMIGMTELNSLLKNNILFLNDVNIADYFVQSHMPDLSLEVLQLLLQFYVTKKIFLDEFLLLVTNSVKLPDINDYLKVSDDIFFLYFDNENYVIDEKFIRKCVKSGSIRKLEKFINPNDFTFDKYYLYCIISAENDNIDICNYFLDYLADNKKILFMFFLELATSSDYIQDKTYSTILDRLSKELFPLLTVEEIFVSIISTYDYQLPMLEERFLRLMNYSMNKKDSIKSYLKEYFSQDVHLYELYKKLEKSINKSDQNFSGTDADIKLIDDWLMQARILLEFK